MYADDYLVAATVARHAELLSQTRRRGVLREARRRRRAGIVESAEFVASAAADLEGAPREPEPAVSAPAVSASAHERRTAQHRR
jgi:hypothetical protein